MAVGPVTAHFAKLIRQQVAGWPAEPDINELNTLLRLAARWRTHVLSRTYQTHHGLRIMGGLFAGMEFVAEAAEGPLAPKLLGVYENELHPHLTAFMAAGIDTVIDVGCAEGYYAVGLARAMPGAKVYAYDIDENAQRVCAELAARNGVTDRVIVGGEFSPDGFEAFAGQRVLVIVDAEGAELDILQPALSPALAGMSIIVETHDVYRPGALVTMIERFSPTHDILRVEQQPKTFDVPPWLVGLPHLDQLLAVWEWRAQPTPWLVMRPKPA
jgi:precorrin-6B methylase 2